MALLQATGSADYLAKAELLFDGCCHKGFAQTDYNWDDQVCIMCVQDERKGGQTGTCLFVADTWLGLNTHRRLIFWHEALTHLPSQPTNPPTQPQQQSSATGLLLYRLTGKEVYKADLENYMTAWAKRPKTPKGTFCLI